MIDYVFAVDNAERWHTENVQRNGGHYAGLVRLAGAKGAGALQRNVGAGVYFNTLVEVEGALIKYGVVETDALVDDLRHWRTLYMSGRMQKPVRVLVDNERVASAQASNLRSALACGLLLQRATCEPTSATTTRAALFHEIVGLSYAGDFRMVVGGESPHKVQNISEGSADALVHWYEASLAQVCTSPMNGDTALALLPTTTTASLIESLPERFLAARGISHASLAQQEPKERAETLRKAVRDTIAWPALTQSLKGIVTAGATKTAVYVGEKLKKRWLS